MAKAMRIILSIPLTWDFYLNRSNLIQTNRFSIISFNSPYLGFLLESHGGFIVHRSTIMFLSIPLTWDFYLNHFSTGLKLRFLTLLSIPLTWDFYLNHEVVNGVGGGVLSFNSPYLGFLLESPPIIPHNTLIVFILSIPLTWDFYLNPPLNLGLSRLSL